ncbi:MAG: hypothetical protein L6300_07790, partial [Syntrophaceae bacterium]|nr:hypothetical protein [Syntrophaceae bacterium]
KQILVLVDAGGSNAYRSHMWKLKLHEQVSQKLGLTVTICHYPPGKSKESLKNNFTSRAWDHGRGVIV